MKSQKHIWWVLKSRLLGDFESQSQIFSSVAAWSHRLGFVIFYPVVQLIELSWWIKMAKQDKAAYWWASTRLHWCFQSFYLALQLNLSTTVTLGTGESSRCREVLNRIQSMDFFVRQDEKRWPLVKVRLYLYLQLAGKFCAKSLRLGFFRSEVLGLEYCY